MKDHGPQPIGDTVMNRVFEDFVIVAIGKPWVCQLFRSLKGRVAKLSISTKLVGLEPDMSWWERSSSPSLVT
jgi:hypothetical protein